MRKLLSRILTLSAVVAITMLNFDSDLVMSFGGKEAAASGNTIPCWSQIRDNDDFTTVFCATCAGEKKSKGVDGEGECTPSNVGVN